jgi:hypothetical protein
MTTFHYTFTRHAERRCAQRGIQPETAILATRFGTPVFKQGLIFYIVRRKDLPDFLPLTLRERLKDLVVVESADTGEIITVYRNPDGMSHVRKKHKRLVVEKPTPEFFNTPEYTSDTRKHRHE